VHISPPMSCAQDQNHLDPNSISRSSPPVLFCHTSAGGDGANFNSKLISPIKCVGTASRAVQQSSNKLCVQVLWVCHTSGINAIFLYLASTESEQPYFMHILEVSVQFSISACASCGCPLLLVCIFNRRGACCRPKVISSFDPWLL
jgi:hypothetical protein